MKDSNITRDIQTKLEDVRIKLMRTKPFFGYSIPRLTFHEDNTDRFHTAAIDHKGNVYYSKKFIEELTDEQLMGVLCHELMHFVLGHFIRSKDFKYRNIANIAQDLIINDVIINLEKMDMIKCSNKMSFNKNVKPEEGGLCPDEENGEYTVITPDGTEVKIKVRGQCFEYVYDCFMQLLARDDMQQLKEKYIKQRSKALKDAIDEYRKNKNKNKKLEDGDQSENGDDFDSDEESDSDSNGKSKGKNKSDEENDDDSEGDSKGKGSDGDGSNNDLKEEDYSDADMFGNSFDDHIWAPEDLTEEEKQALGDLANEMLADAKMYDDKKKNRSPDGSSWLDRLVEDKLKPQVNWKNELKRIIQGAEPYDYTFMKPSKRSHSIGAYMPSIIKESFNVAIAVDVSGSISDEEFAMFIAEFKGILQAKSNVRVRTLFWSTEVDKKNDKKYRRSDLGSLSTKLPEIYSTGGTTISCVKKYIESLSPRDKKDFDMTIYLTDGYIEDDPEFFHSKDKIFIITATGDDSIVKKYGKVIRLNNRD